MSRSVQPEWCLGLPIQQQSVLLLAARGPDGIPKVHPCKEVQRAYRGTVLVAARFGRPLRWGEDADTFMSLRSLVAVGVWRLVMDDYFATVDQLPHHFHLHLAHGAEILGYKHPDARFRHRWHDFYLRCCEDMHLTPESESQMDSRLGDWEQTGWEATA